MKKSLVGAIVGGIIIFIWQFISWGAVNLHKPAQQYTPKQDAVMAVLNSNLELSLFRIDEDYACHHQVRKDCLCLRLWPLARRPGAWRMKATAGQQ